MLLPSPDFSEHARPEFPTAYLASYLNLFMHALSKYLLRTYYIPSTALDAEDYNNR